MAEWLLAKLTSSIHLQMSYAIPRLQCDLKWLTDFHVLPLTPGCACVIGSNAVVLPRVVLVDSTENLFQKWQVLLHSTRQMERQTPRLAKAWWEHRVVSSSVGVFLWFPWHVILTSEPATRNSLQDTEKPASLSLWSQSNPNNSP